ncbi:uncharacterized protein LOC133038422 [Cannabis sativa]|uniref:uncharacterized protein LOC133038422 n=1 Tax=Cannabis sativa TaxID=3483 RepID=UPI0029CA9B6A|nr:uncharacterized protein LOC133038422 [Cannabis sativa]
MQTKINEQEEVIRQLRQQGAPAVPAPEIPVPPAPAVQAEPVVVMNRMEPLYERFRKQAPLELFNAKYYNEAVRSVKRKEFTHLTQKENMSVTEYTTQFDRLARFASGIVPTNFSKKEKHLDWLNAKIRHDLMITTDDITTYAEMVDKALRAEGAVGCMTESVGTPVKRKASTATGGSGQNKRFWGNQGRGSRQGSSETRYTYPECPSCKRHHLGECRGQGCFQCGMSGHYKRDCPQLRNEAPKAPAKPTPARVFAITQADAEASPSVVTGISDPSDFGLIS